MKKLFISTLVLSILLVSLSALAFPIFYKGYYAKEANGQALGSKKVKAGETVFVHLVYGGLKRSDTNKAKVDISYRVVDAKGKEIQANQKVVEGVEFARNDNGRFILNFKLPIGADWKKGLLPKDSFPLVKLFPVQ